MVQEPNPIGITMRVTNMTSTGCTLVFEQSGGNVTGQLQTGEPYDIQKMDSDGNWVSDIKTIVDWKDIAYSIKTNDTTEIDVEWQYVHGAFEPGHYRIKKDVMDFRETADYDTYEIYAEFDVGSPEDSYDEVWHTYNMNGAGNTESEKFTETTDFLPAEVIITEGVGD